MVWLKSVLFHAIFPFHKDSDSKIRFTDETIDEMLQDCPIIRSLVGILSGIGDIDLDEMRMERLSKHLK